MKKARDEKIKSDENRVVEEKEKKSRKHKWKWTQKSRMGTN